jgi:hypothetical protein
MSANTFRLGSLCGAGHFANGISSDVYIAPENFMSVSIHLLSRMINLTMLMILPGFLAAEQVLPIPP